MLPLDSTSFYQPLHETSSTQYYLRKLGAGVSLLGAAGMGLLRYAKGNSSTPAVATILDVVIGAFAQISLECFASGSRKSIHAIQMKYSTTVYLALWTTYLNLPEESPWRDVVLSLICAHVGSSIVVKVSAIAWKKMDGRKYGEKERLSFAFTVDSQLANRLFQMTQFAGGTALLISSKYIPDWESQCNNLGALLIGKVAGELGQEIFESALQKKERAYTQGPVPLSLQALRISEPLMQILEKSFWGALIISNHPAGYAVIGMMIGSSREIDTKKFQKIVASPPEITPRWKQISLIATDALLIGGTTSFCVYGMATGEEIDDIALGSFMGGLVMGLGTRMIADLTFDPRFNRPLMNSLKFFVENPDWLAFGTLYLTEQMDISDTAIANSDTAQMVAAGLGYGSLGLNVGYGFDGETFPRIFDAFAAKVILWRIHDSSVGS